MRACPIALNTKGWWWIQAINVMGAKIFPWHFYQGLEEVGCCPLMVCDHKPINWMFLLRIWSWGQNEIGLGIEPRICSGAIGLGPWDLLAWNLAWVSWISFLWDDIIYNTPFTWEWVSDLWGPFSCKSGTTYNHYV